MRNKDEILLAEAVEDSLSSWNRIQGKNDHYQKILRDMFEKNGEDAIYTNNGDSKLNFKKINYLKVAKKANGKYELQDFLGGTYFYRDFNREREIDEVLNFVEPKNKNLILVKPEIASEQIQAYRDMLSKHERKAKEYYDKHIKGTPAEYYTRNPYTGKTPYSGD